MAKLGHFLATCIIILVFSVPIYTTEEKPIPIPLLNNDFETVDSNGMPANWQINATVGQRDVVRVSSDEKNAHSGEKSLKISHTGWEQSEVFSTPLHFQVGHLYRLSGWVKTESAVTRPMDRYPTPVAACLTMESLPFTNHSPAVGGTSDWTRIETLFIATRTQDRIRLHLGFNGKAMGNTWFDGIGVEKVEDITAYVPMDTVKWFGPAFRYTDKGWIFVHIEGKPYQRGYQYGYLLANEIAAYITKLAYLENNNKPEDGWQKVRFITDAFMLGKYDAEYLTEMRGIADGAAKAGATFNGTALDLLDIVVINSIIDINQMADGARGARHALSGKNFLAAEDELNIPLREHKCSGFLANGPATPNGDIVFGQLFMWNGYTGVHWNVICDVKPDTGHRLVYETFPGGIHSGADFYVNDAGIMIGETTTSQTPLDMNGTPQSNRIRKAAQYASSIDDVVKILFEKNNGMYTNDWLIGDAKTNETAILLLGTKKMKLWRSGTGDFPGGTKGFFWSDNNNKDDEVRKEYVNGPDNAPYDLIFMPWNRDVSFMQFFQKYNGKFDSTVGVNMWASSPINRPHACDGKITTTEMAKQLVFLAHFGKVTLREKFPSNRTRILKDLPNVLPHLSLGYSIISPIFVTEKLVALKKKLDQEANAAKVASAGKPDFAKVKEFYSFDTRMLWFNTVYPASNRENWFISGSAGYWRMLKGLPEDTGKGVEYLTEQFLSMNTQYLYTIAHEEAIAPLEAQRMYDRYGHYRIPRIRGTYLLHQLRLYLGNKIFSEVMNAVHDEFKERPMRNDEFISTAEKIAAKPLKMFIMQWLERKTLPEMTVNATATQTGETWTLNLTVQQKGTPYHFMTSVSVETEKGTHREMVEVNKETNTFVFTLPGKPGKMVFNAGAEIPVSFEDYYTFANYFDDFDHTLFIYGTNQQIEANHTLTLRYRELLADTFTEILPPVLKDSEVNLDALKDHDLIVLGGPADNRIMALLLDKLGVQSGKNVFQWQGKTYGAADDGLILVLPNPYNAQRVVYLLLANSALQLYQMTNELGRVPSWGIFKGSTVIAKGYHPIKAFTIELGQ